MPRLKPALDTLLEATLRVRPGEGRRTALLFTHLLLAASVFILGRTVRDTLFLSRLANPLRVLPWMFVAYGVASSVTVVLYSRVADRMARHRLIVVSCAIGIATYLATWGVVRAGAAWIYPAFYVWAETCALHPPATSPWSPRARRPWSWPSSGSPCSSSTVSAASSMPSTATPAAPIRE